MSFGDNLQTLRKERTLSQERLADDLNVSRQCISKWELESAYPETEKLIALSEYFNVSIDALIKGNIEMHGPVTNGEAAKKEKQASVSHRNMRFVLATCLIMLSPFWFLFSRGAATEKVGTLVFITLLTVISGFGLLLYNYLSNPNRVASKAK